MMGKDLLDLCQLNLMEENIENAPEENANELQKVIAWKKRQVISRIKAELAKEDEWQPWS